MDTLGKTQKAIEYFRQSNLISSKIACFEKEYTFMQAIDRETFLKKVAQLFNNSDLKPDELGAILIKLSDWQYSDRELIKQKRKEFNEVSDRISESKRLLILSKLSFCDQKYDLTYLYLSKLALTSSVEALAFMKLVEEQITQKDSEDFEETSSSESKDETDEKGSKTQGIQVTQGRGEGGKTISSQTTPVNNTEKTIQPKLSHKEKRELKKEQKIAKDNNRHKKRLEKMVLNGFSLHDSPAINVVPQHIEYVFLNKTVRDRFQALRSGNNKFQELLQDTEQCPWATTGSGKPEVLKYKFRGYTGCISRHRTQGDRYVYKVIEARKILVLQLDGHYDD